MAAFAIRLWHLMSTHFVYDDAYITMRVARNIAMGLGYVYNDGSPVQASTSLLYTSLAALFYYFWQDQTIHVMQFLGGLLDSLTTVCIFFIVYGSRSHVRSTSDRLNIYSASLAALLYAVFPTVVLVATGGLETSFVTLFVACTILCLQREYYLLGIFIACISVYLRPDGVLLAISAIMFLIIKQSIKINHISIVIFSGLVYLIGVTSYFGSLLPQTVIAKSVVEHYASQQWSELLNKFFWGSPQASTFGFLYIIGAAVIIVYRRDLLLLCGWGWLYAASFSTFASWWPWYWPPFVIAYLVGIGIGVGFLVNWFESHVRVKLVFISKSIVLIGCVLIITLPAYVTIQRGVQKYGETDALLTQRKEIAAWINANTSPTQKVTVEPLGMIGYFSNVRFDDYPGLVSVDATRALARSPKPVGGSPIDYEAFGLIISAIQPDYLILRENEYILNHKCSSNLANYGVEHISYIDKYWTMRSPSLQNMIIMARGRKDKVILSLDDSSLECQS